MFLVPIALLSSCDKRQSFSQVCAENPAICAEFSEDTWCRKERVAVVFANVALAKQSSDEHKFNALIAYENYEKCMSHASQIEHIKFKEKKTARVENVLKARAKIKQLSDQTIDSKYPRLLYFHWSHYLNKKSLAEFLKLEGDAVMENPESQYELATYYAKRDMTKTRKLLFHALELYRADDVINIEIFETLTSIYQTLGDQKQAYIWLKVLSLALPKDHQSEINSNSLEQFAQNPELDLHLLDKVAKSTLKSIEKGEFVSPMKTSQ